MTTWEDAIISWRQYMEKETGLKDKSITAYVNSAKVWASWADRNEIYSAADVTAGAVRDFRDNGAGDKAATINHRLISITLLLDFLGRKADNPARKVEKRHDTAVEEDGRALSRNEWNAVRRTAEQMSEQGKPRGSSLAEALVMLFRFAGPRVGEVCPFTGDEKIPLTLGDLVITPRTGELNVCNGKGGRARTVPLTNEAREPVRAYLRGARESRVNHWADRFKWSEDKRLWWLSHPSAPVFLGERGPLTTRGARNIIANVGEATRPALDYILGPHDLRATFITALLDPAKYGLVNRDPVPITVVARLAGHANIETTARYARPSQDDLMRYMLVGEAI